MKLNRQHLIITALSILFTRSFSTYGQGIKTLEFLLGTWKVSEVIYPGTDKEFVETGTRTCSYFVADTYIQCKTESTNKYRDRTYVMMINYEEEYEKYIVTTSFSDHDFQGIYHWYLDSAQQTIQSISPMDPGDDEFYRGEISIAEKELIWKGYKTPLRIEKIWEDLYIETSTKVSR